jgi:hypothetical protein
MSWQLKQLAAAIGFKLGFSADERADFGRDVGRRMADCPPRP